MLFNCQKIREDNILNAFDNFTYNKYDIPIKNIDYLYNSFFKDECYKLDFKFNYVEKGLSNITNKSLVNTEEYKSAKKKPVIINFRGYTPQYINCKHSMKDLWWKYANMVPFEIKELQSYKLAATSAQNSFKYGWLLSRIWPYIKPYWFRILLGFAIAIPLGLLDGVTAFALKPYTGTIKENIIMGNPEATVEELMSAIKSAHLQDLIQELPEGLDTMLGERGLTLSGGQRQRVAIARAMLRNAPIVILDEATSALDNESEAIVQKAMDNLMKDRTVFIIAHRLSTIKNADRIAVINEGELVELGTHEELMNIENGQYKALYEMQFKKQEVKV